MTLETVIEKIEARLKDWVINNKTGSVNIKINFNQGGVRDAPVIGYEEKITDK